MWRFWVMVVLTGIAAGLLGALMMGILFNVQYAAFGYHSGAFQHGVEQARDAFLGVDGLALLLVLIALKPLFTALCLGSGASGSLFTPTLSTGAVLGGALGMAWNLAWPGSPSGAFAMIGAAAMIGASLQAPLSGLALVLELTHSGFGLMVPMAAATTIATLVAFHVDGYSIYSARLRAVLVSVGDQDTARDLVDEAFARAWASWRTVSRHPAPKAWVVRTALNAGVSRWRRRRELPVPDLARVADRPAASQAPAGLVDPRIMAALLRLPARQRQVVALRFLLDLDTARTADVLGIAPGTVMAHLGRAMAALRHDLQPELQQEDR